MTASRPSRNEPGAGGAPRCFIEAPDWAAALLPLSEEESHHVLHVLRLREGDRVEVFDGEGGGARAEIALATKRQVSVRPGPVRRAPPPALRLGLVQALPKGAKSDFLLQKAVELGLSRVTLAEAQHSVVRLNAEELEARRGRWRRIAINAAKQCGRNRLPEILAAGSIEAAVRARAPGALWVFGDFSPDARPLRDVLREAAGRGAADIEAAVGPEGGFSPEEVACLRGAGAVPVNLGANVLRTETAALYLMCALAYELGAESQQ